MIKLKHLLIKENYQLAMKLYGDKLTPEDVEFLTKLCGKDYTFKILADLLLDDKQWHIRWKEKDWIEALAQLRNYNKNFLPIKGFSYDSVKPFLRRTGFKNRAEIIKMISEWPSIARRNLRKDLATPRGDNDFHKLHDRIDYINKHLTFLNNRTPEIKAAVLKKIFSSDHPTIEDVLDFVEDKPNLLTGGQAYDKEGFYKLVKQNDYDLKIIYDKGNIVILDVTGQPGIKALGCNSLWCFTYGNEYGLAGKQWEDYSYNGHVYAIVDFNQSQESADFIHILIKPPTQEDDAVLYNMANEPATYGDPYGYIAHIAGDPSVVNLFKWEDLWQ